MAKVIDILTGITQHPLNRGNEIGSVIRFISWQLRSRLARQPLTVDWVCGAKIRASAGDWGITGNIYTGLLEFSEMFFLLHALRSCDVFVDVGANAGGFTILASKVVGAHTIAFEPVPATFKRLLANVEVNEIQDLVTAHNLGLSDCERVLQFFSHQDNINRALGPNEHADDAIDVEVSVMDKMISQETFLLKVDVEGFEYPVLKGAERIFDECAPAAVILELNGSGTKYGYSDEETYKLIRSFDYAPFEYDPLGRSLLRLSDKSKNSPNTIFIRDLGLVEGRIHSAPFFKIHGHSI